MRLFPILLLLICGSYSFADEFAECRGSDAFDTSDVTDKIFIESSGSKIVMATNIDVIESSTKIEFLAQGSIRIFDNSFKMDFVVSPNTSTLSVQAFRNGEFFVEDFACSILK